MKKALVGTILGLVATAATVTSSFGQGQVIFSTYVGTVYQPIVYAEPVPQGSAAGQTVTTGFMAQLYYGFGAGMTFDQLIALADVKAVGTQVAGYVTGGAVTIPGYSSGPVTFAIVAFNGASWSETLADMSNPTAAVTLRENINVWTEPSIATGLNPAGLFTLDVPAITVSAPVPEPSTLALVGLAAGMLALRRRK